MSRLDLLCVGEAFEDLIFYDLPRLPRSGEELKTTRFARTVGGGAVISAVAAARAGVRSAVLSGLHADGERLLEREGIAVRNLRRSAEPHAVTAALSTRRDRAFVTFDGANAALEDRLHRDVRRVADAPRPPRHVHLALGPNDPARWVAVLNTLRQRGVTTSWDLGWNERLARHPALEDLIQSVDYFFVNEAECRLYGRRPTLATALARWRTLNVTTVVKLGSRGARWIGRDVELSATSPRVSAVETTGAGDVFDGVFLASVLQGRPPATCLRRATRAAARSTLSPGGIPTSGFDNHTH